MKFNSEVMCNMNERSRRPHFRKAVRKTYQKAYEWVILPNLLPNQDKEKMYYFQPSNKMSPLLRCLPSPHSHLWAGELPLLCIPNRSPYLSLCRIYYAKCSFSCFPVWCFLCSLRFLLVGAGMVPSLYLRCLLQCLEYGSFSISS